MKSRTKSLLTPALMLLLVAAMALLMTGCTVELGDKKDAKDKGSEKSDKKSDSSDKSSSSDDSDDDTDSSDAEDFGDVQNGSISKVDVEVAVGEALGTSTNGSGVQGNQVDCDGDFDEEVPARKGYTMNCRMDDAEGNNLDLIITFLDSDGRFRIDLADGSSSSSGDDTQVSGSVRSDAVNVDLEVAVGDAVGTSTKDSGVQGNQVDCPGLFDEPLNISEGKTITCSVDDPDGNNQDLLITFTDDDGSFIIEAL